MCRGGWAITFIAQPDDAYFQNVQAKLHGVFRALLEGHAIADQFNLLKYPWTISSNT